MSPMISIVTAFGPYEPLHFHAASAAASVAMTDDMATTTTRLHSAFIAILPTIYSGLSRLVHYRSPIHDERRVRKGRRESV